MYSLGRASFALLVSALIIVLSFLGYHYVLDQQGLDADASLSISGRQFQTITGITRLQGDSLVLERFGAEGAVLTRRAGLRAQNYPLLRYQFEGLQPGVQLQFFWRTEDGSMFATPIPRSGGHTFVHLASREGWRGTITDVALNVTGNLRDQPLIIPGIDFEAFSWQGVTSAVISEWTEFRGMSSTSINVLFGTAGGVLSETPSPTLAMASWAGLALVLLYGISVVQGRKSVVSYCAAVLIPWIALDLLWQSELSTQLRETRLAFGGKTTHQKHLGDQDGPIYNYAKRLKEDVLPASSARIVILRNSIGHDYIRLKTQYYLLPHNIYNFGAVPPAQGIHAGDYILVLGDIPELRYLSAEELLVWKPNNRIQARRIDTDGNRQLFQVIPADSGDAGGHERAGRD